MLLGIFTWLRAQQIIKAFKNDPERKWAADLAAMIQVSMVGYAAGGAFLGLSYWDLPYHLMITVVLTAKFTGLLDPKTTLIDSTRPQSSKWSGPHANRI